MDDGSPSLGRVLLSAFAALTVGLGAVSVAAGFSDSFLIRVIQGVAVFAAGAIVLGGVVVLVLVRLAGWHEPADEGEFEAIVQRAERLAAEGRWGAVDERLGGGRMAGDERLGGGRMAGDEDDLDDDDDEQEFRALVRGAIDDLPLEFHRVLEHVAIVVTDGGRERHAYGLYQGDTVARDYFSDRIFIFRDTLTRDFGHDPELLRAQVTRTVRHELAHHLGWGETGVRGLGL
jgi:predicted Zn-dependent protease with MMP-like domain